MINNHHHFNFINAQSENLSNSIKAVINKNMRDIVNEPEICDRNNPVIYEMFWVAPIYLDIPQEVLYENINYQDIIVYFPQNNYIQSCLDL